MERNRIQSSIDAFLSSCILALALSMMVFDGASGSTFTFTNNCEYTVWPGILPNAGSAPLETTGFELPAGQYRSLQAPTGWSGRFWGRTGCSPDGSGQLICATADCGSGQAECSGSGAAPPVTLAEFTLSAAGGQDFYDVSLVDGFNLPLAVSANGGSGSCGTTGCAADLALRCPTELRADGGGCRSACEAFGEPEYCCSEEYGTPDRCRPSVYSAMFKSACPSSYSYAYDDATSTFTCARANYVVAFCPSVPTSQKSSKGESSPRTEAGTDEAESDSGRVVLSGDSWLASLATADARSTFVGFHSESLQYLFIFLFYLLI